jgi:hypothetical protein
MSDETSRKKMSIGNLIDLTGSSDDEMPRLVRDYNARRINKSTIQHTGMNSAGGIGMGMSMSMSMSMGTSTGMTSGMTTSTGKLKGNEFDDNVRRVFGAVYSRFCYSDDETADDQVPCKKVKTTTFEEGTKEGSGVFDAKTSMSAMYGCNLCCMYTPTSLPIPSQLPHLRHLLYSLNKAKCIL